MKIKLLLFLSLIFWTFSYAKTPSNAYHYKFVIKGLPKDSTAYIGYFFGKNQFVKQDTAKIEDGGVAIFEGSKPLDKGVYILSWPKGFIEFVVGDQFAEIHSDTAELIDNSNVVEGTENKIFYEYQKTSATINFDINKLRKKEKQVKGTPQEKEVQAEIKTKTDQLIKYRDDFFKKYPQALATKLFKAAQDIDVPESPKDDKGKPIDPNWQYYYFKNHYWDNIDLSDDAMVKTPFFHSKLETYFKNLVLANPDSAIKDIDITTERMKSKETFKYTVWYIFNKYEEDKLMGMDAVLVHMADKYYLSGKAYWVDTTTKFKIKERANILRPLLIGKKAPEAYLTDSANKPMYLSSVKGKSVIMVFWDPDCGHCQKEIPEIFKYAKANADKGLVVYSVGIIRKPEPWKKYIRDNKLFAPNWINVWDGLTVTDFARMWDVYATPVTYILDENKKIIAKRLIAEQFPEFFEKYVWKTKPMDEEENKEGTPTPPKSDKKETPKTKSTKKGK